MIKSLTLAICLGAACVGTALASNPGMDQTADQVTSLRRTIAECNPQLEKFCQDMLSKGCAQAEIDKMLYTEGCHLSLERGKILGVEKKLFKLLNSLITEKKDNLKSGVNAVIGGVSQVSRNELNEIMKNYYFCYYATTAGLKELIKVDGKRVNSLNAEYELYPRERIELGELETNIQFCQELLGDAFAELRKLYDLIHQRDQQLIKQQVLDEAASAAAIMREQAELARRQQEEVSAMVNEVVQVISSGGSMWRFVDSLNEAQIAALNIWAQQNEYNGTVNRSLTGSFTIVDKVFSLIQEWDEKRNPIVFQAPRQVTLIPINNKPKSNNNNNNNVKEKYLNN